MRSKVYGFPFDEIFKACKQAIRRYDFTIDSENRDEGTIVTSTPPTIFSWGEEILIEIQRVSRDRTKVTLKSSPNAQLFDWGKGKENEDKIIAHLDNLLRG